MKPLPLSLPLALALALALAMLAPGVVAPGDDAIRGSGRIACELAYTHGRFTCDWADYDSRFPSIDTTGAPDNVTFTLTWSANSADAIVLSVALVGSNACVGESEDESCFRAYARGPSPLVLRLNGAAVEAARVRAYVSAANVCNDGQTNPGGALPNGCENPPYRLVRNQAFQYAWVVR